MKKIPMLLLAGILAACPARAQHAQENISDIVRPQITSAYSADQNESKGSPIDSGFVQYNQASRWVMRGLPFSDGRVSQLIGRANYGKISGILFVNYDPDKECLDNKFRSVVDEVDVIGVYTTNMFEDNVTLSFWAVHEFLSHQKHDQSTEFKADLQLNNIVVTPILTFAKDVANGKGEYLSAGIIKTLPLGFADLTIGAEAAYNFGYWRDDSGPSHLGASITLSRNITNDLAVQAIYAGTRSLADDIKNTSLGQLSIVYNLR